MTSTETPIRHIGRCPNCGTGIGTQSFARKEAKSCPNCGTKVILQSVKGVHNDQVSCDSRCEFAISPDCSCACGGDNHAIGYVAWELVPVWVTERDAKRFSDAKERKAARAKAEKDSARKFITNQIEAQVALRPELEIFLATDLDERYNSFVADIARKFVQFGSLSERQIEVALASIEKTDAIKAANEARAARQAAGQAKPCPTGRVSITGTVLSIKFQENNFSYHATSVKKIRVETTEGWIVFVTCPDSIWDTEVGDKIYMDVTVEAKEEFFGFGKSPRKAVKI